MTLAPNADVRGRRGAIDTLVVAGGQGARAAATDRTLVRAIASLARRARRVTSVCTGAFLLGAAGLLDGRRATTHWRWCDALARQLSVPTLAARAGMSPRNFARVFGREVGVTPAAYVEQVRVELARRLLETGTDSVEVIAAAARVRPPGPAQPPRIPQSISAGAGRRRHATTRCRMTFVRTALDTREAEIAAEISTYAD